MHIVYTVLYVHNVRSMNYIQNQYIHTEIGTLLEPADLRSYRIIGYSRKQKQKKKKLSYRWIYDVINQVMCYVVM